MNNKVEKIQANIRGLYREHCILTRRSAPYSSIHDNLEQRRITFEDVFIASGMSGDDMKQIEFEVGLGKPLEVTK